MRITLSIPLTIEDIRSATAATLVTNGNVCNGLLSTVITSITTDSREVLDGDLFIALRGERFDANLFLSDVFAKGAAVALGCGPLPDDCKGALLKVQDATRALAALSVYYAKKIPHKTVAVTGSVGKTTTKELLAAVLSAKYRVHATSGNLNNQLGLPLTVLSMPADTEILITEMGMSDRGEIEYLSRIAKPDAAIITNVGSSHLERLGSRENIGRAKMEITAGMSQNALLLLHGDDKILRTYASHPLHPEYISLNANSDSDVIATNIVEYADSSVFDARLTSRTLRNCRLCIPGRHTVSAALFALAVGDYFGMNTEELQNGLSLCNPERMHQRIINKKGITVIDDCYNAAPESMRAALKILSLQKEDKGGRAVALLGDMKELGAQSAALHETVGQMTAEYGVDFLIAYGDAALDIAKGAQTAGMDEKRIFTCEKNDIDKAVRILQSILKENDVFLVKASRSMRAENVLNAFLEA